MDLGILYEKPTFRITITEFEIESVTTLSKSMSDLVTISTSESQVEEAFHWPEFQNHDWQSSGGRKLMS